MEKVYPRVALIDAQRILNPDVGQLIRRRDAAQLMKLIVELKTEFDDRG